jgi:hypothetical protein
VKDRAALGIIEAAEADGRCVRLFVPPPRDLFYSAHAHGMHGVLYIHRKNKNSEKLTFDTLFITFSRRHGGVVRTPGSSQAEQSWKAQRATRVSAWRTSVVQKDTAA